MSIFNRFLRLVLSDFRLTLKLIHPRRIKNALRFLIFDSGNLGQLYRRYQEIYSQPDAAEGRMLAAEIRAGRPGRDIFIFPIIDWHFRMQRPQHIATRLSERGYRIFYFSTMPLPRSGDQRYQLTGKPAENIFLCKLQADGALNDDLHRHEMKAATRTAYLRSLAAFMQDFQLGAPAVIFQHHYWQPLAGNFPVSRAGYDCMDHHVAFHEPGSIDSPEQEIQLIRQCDFVVASSLYLQKKIESIKPCTIIRNGCDATLFSTVPARARRPQAPVAGYVGAIAEWFDMALLVEVARQMPHWQFILVGAYAGCDVELPKTLPNIQLIGEVEYARIPSLLADFDVCIIPFKLTELTKATNPVKVYEYLSAGKPVVSTPLPEVTALGERVFIGDTPALFALRLQQAFEAAEAADFVDIARHWASEHDWSARADQFEALLTGSTAPSKTF